MDVIKNHVSTGIASFVVDASRIIDCGGGNGKLSYLDHPTLARFIAGKPAKRPGGVGTAVSLFDEKENKNSRSDVIEMNDVNLQSLEGTLAWCSS